MTGPARAVLILLLLALSMPAAPAWSAAPGGGSPVGYGGAKIQMMPIMAPYRTPSGVRYQVLTLRLVLAPNPETERPACFMVPIIHEKILLYLYGANLQLADFSGQRLEVLATKLLEVATATTDRGYFTGVEFLDDQSMLPPAGNVKTASSLDPRSQTLSSQCR
jgi:hypothetical protein